MIVLNQSVKKIQVVKLTDMFQISAWKFYYKLSNNLLPSYFNHMKPSLPVICNYYGIYEILNFVYLLLNMHLLNS